MAAKKQTFVEKTPEGDFAVRKRGNDRASAVKSTQKEAIKRAKELEPTVKPLVERVRAVAGKPHPDKWRKA